jgi:hypothetical protein
MVETNPEYSEEEGDRKVASRRRGERLRREERKRTKVSKSRTGPRLTKHRTGSRGI